MTNPTHRAPGARELFQRHHAAVYRYLVRCTGYRDRAEELTQDVFLRAIRALPHYRHDGREEAWIFTLARNVALDEQARRARRPGPGLEIRSGDSVERPRAGLRADLEAALAGLPPAERSAFLLREVGGLTYAEIAAATETTADGVRGRIFRARRALRAALGGDLRRATPGRFHTGTERR